MYILYDPIEKVAYTGRWTNNVKYWESNLDWAKIFQTEAAAKGKRTSNGTVGHLKYHNPIPEYMKDKIDQFDRAEIREVKTTVEFV